MAPANDKRFQKDLKSGMTRLSFPGYTAFTALSAFLLALIGAAPQEPTQSGAHPIHFVDVAPRSHFSYITNNGFSWRKYLIQPMAGGVAIFDYNNDGKMDIFLSNGAQFPGLQKAGPGFYNALLRNRGDGTFEDVSGQAGVRGENQGYNFGVAIGDYDNDGFEDLFLCGATRNTLYHNNGNGTFTDVTAQSGLDRMPPSTVSLGAAWFDFDNDGLVDLVVANYTIWSPETDRRCTVGSAESYCTPAYYKSVPHRLFHNLGHGRFEDVTESSGFGSVPGKGMGISVADFDGDGRQDVFIANDTERNSLFMNAGHGRFEERAIQAGVAYNSDGKAVSSMGSDAKDFDNDGHVGVFSNNLAEQTWQIFRNFGGSFRPVSDQTRVGPLSRSFSGWSGGFVDYDNDGWKDLYSANGNVDDVNIRGEARQHDTMFQNVGGRFRDVSGDMGPDFLRTGYQRGSAFGDLNNDGFQDLVVTSLMERPRILINSGGNDNHWIVLELVGTLSNRDAIGATVKLTTASGRTLYNHVAISVGFMSSSDKRVHFGLGTETQIRSIEIRWPHGGVQRLTNVSVNQFRKVREEVP